MSFMYLYRLKVNQIPQFLSSLDFEIKYVEEVMIIKINTERYL